MKELLVRIGNILFSPRQEWKAIHQEHMTDGKVPARHVAVIAAVPPLAAVAERLLFGGGIAGRQPLGYVFATNVVWYFLILLNMAITAAVITAIVDRKDRRWISITGLQLAFYSYTPVFLVTILMVIPRMNWLIYVAILYSLSVLYLGIRTMTGVEPGKAALYAAGSFLGAGLIVGFLNGVEYMLESFVAERILLN